MSTSTSRGVSRASLGAAERLTRLLEGFFEERSFTDTAILGVRHGRSATTFTIAAPLPERARLVEGLSGLGERFGLTLDTRISADHDVLVRFSGVRPAQFPTSEEDRLDAPRLLPPLGVLSDRSVFSFNWRALGHLLVASRPGRGTDVILVTILASLASRCRPEQLRVWTTAAPHTLPDVLAEMPHQARGFVDPSDAVDDTLEALERELEYRLSDRASTTAAEIVLLVAELTTLEEYSARFQRILRDGPVHGIRMLAATTESAGQQCSLLPYCTSRVVLRLLDESASMALLGSGDAVYLERGGRFMAHLEGRAAFEAYAYRIPADHLEQLVRKMVDAYSTSPEVSAGALSAPPEQEDDGSAPSDGSDGSSDKAEIARADAPAEARPAETVVNGAYAPNLTGRWLVTPPFTLQLFGFCRHWSLGVWGKGNGL